MYAKPIDTAASAPAALVDIINGLVLPAQEACYAAMREFVAWRTRDEQRRKTRTADATDHIAQGVRTTTALRDALKEAHCKLGEADNLAGVMLALLDQRGGLLVDMGVNPAHIERDRTDLTLRREGLRVSMNALLPLIKSAETMPVALNELVFAVAAARAHDEGRSMRLH